MRTLVARRTLWEGRALRRRRTPWEGRALAATGLIVALATAACGGPTLVKPGSGPDDATMPPLLAGLEVATVGIGPRQLRVAVADTPFARSRGLAGTQDLGPVDGVLFVYPEAVETAFWMLGVDMPLDLAFVGPDERVLAVLTMPTCPADPCSTYAPPGPFRWAVETPAGGLRGVVPGDLLAIAGG